MSQPRSSDSASPGENGPDGIATGRSGLYAAEKQGHAMPRQFYSFDDDYLLRLTQGDPDVQRHFAEYFSPLLRAKLQQRVRCAQDAEDLRQEVFLRVLQSLRSGPGVHDAAKLGAFVNAVCNNVVLEHIRTRSRLSQFDEGAQDPAITDQPERQVLSDEVRAQVRVVLDDLPERDRRLLRAVFLEERDKDLVCRDYGVERNHLRVILHRARRRLRDLLAPPSPPAHPALRTTGGAHQ